MAKKTVPAAAGATAEGDMPRDMAHDIDAELGDTLALLQGAMDAIQVDRERADANGLTSPSSRTISLLRIAERKVCGVLQSMAPYV